MNPVSLTILHLEDNDADAELFRHMLREQWPDCAVRRASNRAEFTAALAAGRVDLVLSDYTLTDFDALAALRLVRRAQPDLPFVFLSGSIGEDHAVAVLKEGATDYVLKDRPVRLVPAIERALAEARGRAQQRQAEAQLRDSQERFLKLAEQSSDVFWFVQPDPETVEYVSPAFAQVWGRPVDDLYRDPGVWEAAIHPADRPRVAAAYDACLRGTAPRFDEEYRVIRPDGDERWVLDSGIAMYDPAGRLVRISGIAKDVTAHKRAEQHIRDQAELIDKAHEAIYLRDLDDRVYYWNKSAEDIFGYAKEDVLGHRITDLKFRADGMEQFLAAKAALLKNGEWTGELHLTNRRGQELDLQASWTLLRDREGRPKGILCIDMDVTRQRALEKQFHRSQRQDSVGMLAGGIAHDLNNVLAPILMAIELLRTRVTDAESQRLLAVLESSAHHGAGLVRQVLAFSRGTDGERVALDPREVIGEVVKLLHETLPRSIRIETDFAADLPKVTSNSTELGQVLMNLCVNARDAMPDGGRILIRAAGGRIDDALGTSAPWVQPGPCLVITVADSGSGIPPHIIDRIFDPFFTTKQQGKGTGLGLSTVLGIIKSHGGLLQVRSSPEQGTEFQISLPLGEAVDVDAAPPEMALPPARGHDELVLVIDDEQPVRNVARAILQAYGYRVLEAADGPSGLAIFQEQRGAIRAVVTDMMMPVMQGPEVITRLRELAPDVGIVAVSGMIEKAHPVTESTHGVVFLQKPMTAAQLIATLRQVLPAA